MGRNANAWRVGGRVQWLNGGMRTNEIGLGKVPWREVTGTVTTHDRRRCRRGDGRLLLRGRNVQGVNHRLLGNYETHALNQPKRHFFPHPPMWTNCISLVLYGPVVIGSHRSTTRSTLSSAIARYVVHLPSAIVMGPLEETMTTWLRTRLAVQTTSTSLRQTWMSGERHRETSSRAASARPPRGCAGWPLHGTRAPVSCWSPPRRA
jgi:hypothetical protein